LYAFAANFLFSALKGVLIGIVKDTRQPTMLCCTCDGLLLSDKKKEKEKGND
jgi:hypothetical protein